MSSDIAERAMDVEDFDAAQLARLRALQYAKTTVSDHRTPVDVDQLLDVADYIVQGTKPVDRFAATDLLNTLAGGVINGPLPGAEVPDLWGSDPIADVDEPRAAELCPECKAGKHLNCGGACDCPDVSH